MANLCCSSKRGHQLDELRPVPESLDDITSEWCEWALRKGMAIGQNTTVTTVNVKRFKNDETGVLDGGGLGGAIMVRIILTYGGLATGNEPASVVCKLSLGGQYKIPFKFRILSRMKPSSFAENRFRNEVSFVENAIPALRESGYQHPAVYYSGIMDGGTRGFVSHVVFDSKIKVKAVVLMEDMTSWNSKMSGDILEQDELAAILRNSAILHAAFWGMKGKYCQNWFKHPANAEIQYRGPAYSWMLTKYRNSGISSSSAIQKQMTPLVQNWGSSNAFTLKKDMYVPDWITTEPLEDGTIHVLTDPVISELIEVFAQRFPEFNKLVIEPYFNLQEQTLLHGDCHGGNHMYHKDSDKVISLDFQCAGRGRVTSEFLYLLSLTPPRPFEKDMELLTVYHDALVQQGVTDYSFEDFKREVRIACLEMVVGLFGSFAKMKPDTFNKVIIDMGEKGVEFLALFEKGIMLRGIVLVASIYIENKEGFLALST